MKNLHNERMMATINKRIIRFLAMLNVAILIFILSLNAKFILKSALTQINTFKQAYINTNLANNKILKSYSFILTSVSHAAL